jgi:hypothetical protein
MTPLQINIHQLAYHAGCIWAVSPRTNSLIGVHPNSNDSAVEFDLLGQRLRSYVPHDAKEAEDKHHFNSLLWTNEHLIVAAHNFTRPSFINCYERHTLYLEFSYFHTGFNIHGLASYQNELFWISTGTGEIRSNFGYCYQLSTQRYARGFAMTDRYFIVGISEFLHRNRRRSGDSWVQVIDRERGVLGGEFHLRGTGSINDLRLLDAYDYAHCIDPFWS